MLKPEKAVFLEGYSVPSQASNKDFFEKDMFN